MALGLYCSEFLSKLEHHEYKIDEVFNKIINVRNEFILQFGLCLIDKKYINYEKFYDQGKKIKKNLIEILNKRKILYIAIVKEYIRLSLKTGSLIEKEMFIELSNEYKFKYSNVISLMNHELTYQFDKEYLKKNNYEYYDHYRFNKKQKFLSIQL